MALLCWPSWSCGREDGQLTVASPCVQRSLIDCVNAVLLVAYVSTLAAGRGRGAHRWRWELVVVCVCCVVAATAYCVAGFHGASVSAPPAVSLFRGLVWVALAASLHVQPTRPTRATAILWWTLFSLLITAYNAEVLAGGHTLNIAESLAWPVNFLLLLCALASLLGRSHGHHRDAFDGDGLSEHLIDKDKVVHTSELYRAGLFSQLAFSWLNPLLCLGRSKVLDLADIPLINREDSAQHASQKFAEAWSRHMRDKGGSRRSRSSNGLALVLCKCFLGEILLSGFYAFMRTLSIAVAPLLLFAFVWYSNQEERDLRDGLSLVGCMLVMKVVESLSQRHWFFDSRRTGMRIRSALMAVIFQKQLRLSSQGRKNHSTGEIVNYIAVDAYRLGDAINWLHTGWSSPLQLAFAVGTLFWALKLGALPGLVPLIIFGFLNVPFAKILQRLPGKFHGRTG